MRIFYRLILLILIQWIASNYIYAQCGTPINFNSGASIVANDVLCKGDSTGEIILSIYTSNGSYPYTWFIYQGSTSGPIVFNGTAAAKNTPVVSVQTGDGDLQNIPAGTYILVTCNNSGQQLTNITITINEPSVLFSALLTATSPPSCAGTCGNAATVTGSGGNPNYDFFWSNGQTDLNVASSTRSALCAGADSLIINDQNGCDTTLHFTILESPLPIASAGNDQLICSGSSGTSIGGSPTATAGTSPFSYSWDNTGTLSSSVVSNPTATPSSTTTYSVTVTDVNSCSGTDAVIITVNPAISISFTSTNVACNGGSTGMAVASASGGTSPFSYVWNTSPSQANDTASNLTDGTYTVTVTDASSANCTKVDSVTIAEPSVLSVSISSIPISCNGINDGSLTANPTGGTTNYSYFWNTLQTTQTINSLSAGTYSVTVTDANACTDRDTFILTSPTAINANLTKVNSTCSGACNGTASVAPTGGSSPYIVSWSTGSSGN